MAGGSRKPGPRKKAGAGGSGSSRSGAKKSKKGGRGSGFRPARGSGASGGSASAGAKKRKGRRGGHKGPAPDSGHIDSRSSVDHYTVMARKEGYPARSVYKLSEIDERVRLFKPGQRVLDLGAAPGSWTLYASRKVGERGAVLAIDLLPNRIEAIGQNIPENVDYRQGDARDQTVETLGGTFDVVISDMAPNTSGFREADMYRSYELVVFAAQLADTVLRPGGHFVAKIFQGAEFEDARAELRKRFETVRTMRPKATRNISYEVFLVGVDYQGAPGEAEVPPSAS